MQDVMLNIMNGEWIIIFFVTIVLLLGTNRLPEVAKKLGKIKTKYTKMSTDIRDGLDQATNLKIDSTLPVDNERKKLEIIAKSINLDSTDMDTISLQKAIDEKMNTFT
ncbi:MAG: twin-arginine translocase TatA/TatE family subunit [Candidatus Nitrosoabyssus spongiisocia]|nr:MAG: twin-arginine translocase TatA/TatE family subunit [Nitrosopumilaceae archaeon AB1(1)]